jgi:AraC family transcriptional regulator
MTLGAGTLGGVSHSCTGDAVTASLVRHPGALRLAPHHHPRATVTVLLGGVYAESLEGSEQVLSPLDVCIKPAGVPHANRVGARGATSLLLEVHPERLAALGCASGLFTAPCVRGIGPGATIAMRIARELRYVDETTPLAVESLVMEWFALAAVPSRTAHGSLPWVERVRERLHEPDATKLTLAELAADAGHHPSYVARAFRRQVGVSIGEYARRVRLARAARSLACEGRRTLSRIALETGYADHSHLTHDFRARVRTTPAAWRRSILSALGS